MKHTIIVVLIALVVGVLLGFSMGYNYSFPIAEQSGEWTKTRRFGRYIIRAPRNSQSASLRISLDQRPYHPLVALEDKASKGYPQQLLFYDNCNSNSVSVEQSQPDGSFRNLCLQVHHQLLMDCNLDGAWDARNPSGDDTTDTQEFRIGSEWFKCIEKDGTMFVETKDGLRQVKQNKAGFSFADEKKSNQAPEVTARKLAEPRR